MRQIVSFVRLLVMIIFCLFFSPAWVQAVEQADGGKNKEPSVIQSSLQLKLSGYAQMQGVWQNDPGDTFSIRRARLSLGGQLLKSLKFKLQFDFTKSPALLDALAEVILRHEINLRVGQFLVPFSLENITSTSDLQTINRSLTVEKLAPGRDIGASGRDIGVAAFGSCSIFNYTFGLLNGSGLNKADNNDHKDFAGRLLAHPLKTLSLGFSIYKGRLTSGDNPAQLVRNRYGLELAFNYQHFGLQAEFIQATDDRIKKQGWYALAIYDLISQKLQLVARLETIDLDRNQPAQKTTVYTAGVNWFITSRSKLQANYEYHQIESEPDHQAALVLLQVGF
ncbi:MAG: porin [Acidobacteriota bacterium]|nr:porin [Acidobacteriota bacterium]